MHAQRYNVRDELSYFPANLAFPDASTIHIDCVSREMAGLTLPDVQPGVMRLVVGTDFARLSHASQNVDANSIVVSQLDLILAHYVHGRADIHSSILYVDATTTLNWQTWLERVNPAGFPANLVSLSITASPFYCLSHVMQETHTYDFGELDDTLTVFYEFKFSADGLFLLAGNPMAGLMSSLGVTKPVDSQFLADNYDSHIQTFQKFLSAASNLKKLELPLNFRRSLATLLHYSQDLRYLVSINITPSNDLRFDQLDSFSPPETDFLKKTFASTVEKLRNLETVSFPALLMSEQLLLALSGLPKLNSLTVSMSPGLKTEDTIVQATAGLRKPLPKMRNLNSLIIEVTSGEEVRAPFHRRTRAMTPNADRRRTVFEHNEDIGSPGPGLHSNQGTGPSHINFRLS